MALTIITIILLLIMFILIILIIIIIIIILIIIILIIIILIIIIVSHGVRASAELLDEERVVCGQQVGHRNEVQLVQPGCCAAGGGVAGVDGARGRRRGGARTDRDRDTATVVVVALIVVVVVAAARGDGRINVL